MSTQHNNQQHKENFQLERIALFSDAVFAIAITLLIIEVKVPSLPATNPAFSERFPEAMNEMSAEFIGFIISFAVIGNFWRFHHTMFNFVAGYDRKLLQLNNLFLFTIVIMPFTTAFMSRYAVFQPFFIYCLNVIAAGLLQISLWRHITNEKSHLSTGLPAGMKAYKITGTLVSIGCFFLSMIIHKLPFWPGNFGGVAARVFLVSIFFINMLTDRYYRKKYQLNKKY